MSSLWTPDGERPVGRGDNTDPSATEQPELTPEQQAQAEAMAKELSEARARLLETDVADVLANHAMGIYELAAIHLTADEPKLDQAQTAIDALAALLGELKGRLGQVEPTLLDALHQIRLAFVQRQNQVKAANEAAVAADQGETEPPE